MIPLGLAGLVGTGKSGKAIESGSCRSTWRVPVMKQSEHKSANDALVIQAQGRQFGPHNLNQMKRMRYSVRYCIRYGAENLRCVAQTNDIAYYESIRHCIMMS